jgi:hypothetical protein
MSASTTDPLQLLTTAQVAALMGMSPGWVTKQRKSGRITPHPGLGRSVRYTRRAVEKLQASLRKASRPEAPHLAAVVEMRRAS